MRFIFSSSPSRAGALKVGLIPVLPECGLRASPVSWLGGFTSASFPRRRLANVSLQCPALCCFRLTVARRRRLALRPLAISAAHRLPVHEACGYCRGRHRPLCAKEAACYHRGVEPARLLHAGISLQPIRYFPERSLSAALS